MNPRIYRIIGYLITALLVYYILQIMAPYLLLGLAGLIIYQIFHHSRKQ